jgi:phosphoglycolate phosphatase-like HAD superfamily hydrolase
MREAVIFDVDGTLADVSGVRHYVLDDPRRKNFDLFHAASSYVPAHTDVVDLARTHHTAGHAIVVVTARSERWRYRTATWLQKHDIPHDHLLMRRNGDQRKDVEVKREILTKIRQHYDVILAVDDNPSVIALWQDEHIPVRIIPGWTEPPDIRKP